MYRHTTLTKRLPETQGNMYRPFHLAVPMELKYYFPSIAILEKGEKMVEKKHLYVLWTNNDPVFGWLHLPKEKKEENRRFSSFFCAYL